MQSVKISTWWFGFIVTSRRKAVRITSISFPIRPAGRRRPQIWLHWPDSGRDGTKVDRCALASPGYVFRPRYGRVGWVVLPYMWIFEFLAPLVELVGYSTIVTAFMLGELSKGIFLAISIVWICLRYHDLDRIGPARRDDFSPI